MCRVLPGEPDATVVLYVDLGVGDGRVRCHNAGGLGLELGVVVTAGHSKRCQVRELFSGIRAHGHVGTAVLDRLE